MYFEYDYECQDCGYIKTIKQKPSDKKRFKKCPECKKLKLERVILSAPQSIIEREPTTIGQIAERNNKKLGKYGLEDKERQTSPKKTDKKPDIWDHIGELPKDKKKSLNSPEKVKKYIMEGK